MRLARPDRVVSGVKLSPHEFSEMMRITGTVAKEQIDFLVQAPYYDDLPDGLKKEMISEEYTAARKVAREVMEVKILQSSPERIIDVELEKLNALTQ